MPTHKAQRRIAQLDPERDHCEIMYLISAYEFPFDTTRALEFALYRTYAVVSIGTLLDRTGEFRYRAQKRYDDTDLVLSEIVEHGYDSERGKAAIARMNAIHGRFGISNEDFLYVLSTLVFEPIRWNARFGWRPMTQREKLGTFYFWREVGRRMDIRDIPESYAAFAAYNVEYERSHFQYSDGGSRVAGATREMFLSWFLPVPLRRLGRPAIYALLDDTLLEAFGFPGPPRAMRTLVQGGLELRGRLLRFLPERKEPRIRTKMPHRSYPHGYQIENLGPGAAS